MAQPRTLPPATLSLDPLSVGVLLMMALGLIIPTTPEVRAILDEAQDWAT